MQLESLIQIKYNKKLYYCRKTAWHDVSVKIFPNVAQQCSNNFTTSPEQIKVIETDGYSRPGSASCGASP